MVGRPRQFEHDVALGRAMEVFWTHGYEATSVQDLLDAMQINRGSMYDTFGDKRELFLKAIEHYGEMMKRQTMEILEAPGSPMANIRKLLDRWAQMAAAGDDCCESCRGCLLCNTAVELAPHDPRIGEFVRSMIEGLEKALQQTLERARDCGELSKDSSPRALARFLTNTVHGLAVMCKTNVDRAVVKDVVDVTKKALV